MDSMTSMRLLKAQLPSQLLSQNSTLTSLRCASRTDRRLSAPVDVDTLVRFTFAVAAWPTIQLAVMMMMRVISNQTHLALKN